MKSYEISLKIETKRYNIKKTIIQYIHLRTNKNNKKIVKEVNKTKISVSQKTKKEE